MAKTKKRTSARTSTPSGTAKRTTTKNKKQSYIKDYVYAVILFCLTILVVLSLVTDLIGHVGEFLKDSLLGLFGPGAFLLPVYFFYIAVMLIATNKKLTSRGVFGIIFILLFSAFFNLIVFEIPEMGETPLSEYLNILTGTLFDAGKTSIESGGVFGGYISVPLFLAFDKVGAGIIIFTVMLITFIVATGINIRALFERDNHRVSEESPDLEKERRRTEKQLEKLAREKEKAEREMNRQLEEIRVKTENIEKPEETDPKTTAKRKRFRLFATPKEADSGKVIDQYLDDIHTPYQEEAESARKARPDLFDEKESVFDGKFVGGPDDNENLLNSLKEETKEEKTTESLLSEIRKTMEDAELKKEIADAQKTIAASQEIKTVKEETAEAGAETDGIPYKYPPVELLNYVPTQENLSAYEELKQNAEKLIDTLRSFNIDARVINISRGPSVTRYELQPSTGVRVSKITNLADDIALQLAAVGVRIEAPIPGKSAIGIEVPNKTNTTVYLRELIDSDEFKKSKSKLTVGLGKDITGGNVVADLAKMPHLMIAGATGSGKSVCVNSMLISLLYRAAPEDVKLILVDPKVVELNVYNGLPHLLIPVVTEAKKAAGALGWAVSEMLKRYELFKEKSVRDFAGYNASLTEEEQDKKLPQIVIVIDEMADLMMTAPHEVEDAVCRLAQMARAAGMHLVIATQRPSADVITGTIKANIPSRIAFAVSSAVNSRIILDESGAEKLVGKGDMLYFPVGAQKATRVQGCFVSDKEVEKVISFIKENSAEAEYDDSVMEKIAEEERNMDSKNARSKAQDDDYENSGDEDLVRRATEVVVNEGRASTSVLQRRLSLGYARAARIMDELYERGIIGPYQGSKPREVLISKQQYLEMLNRGE